ncbi:MAG: hypothetical protein JO341_07625 [Gammaproteobacteria bacterium]|nr:hypothetical protein [Gammaproteobacteria bacterium]MBV9620878.1 hypothetical protein [Gammaproteobacteria bacterium]
MSRLALLAARRRALIERAAVEREELSSRLGALNQHPLARAAHALLERPRGSAAPLAHPLAWAAGLAGLMLLRRPRRLMSLVLLVRSVSGAASRAAMLMRLLGELRRGRATPAPPEP